MDLKFYLNKFLKVDNIENYTLSTLTKLKECYNTFIDNTEGSDPDFPLINFNSKGKKVGGTNIYSILEEGEEANITDKYGQKINAKTQEENFKYLEKIRQENYKL